MNFLYSLCLPPSPPPPPSAPPHYACAHVQCILFLLCKILLYLFCFGQHHSMVNTQTHTVKVHRSYCTTLLGFTILFFAPPPPCYCWCSSLCWIGSHPFPVWEGWAMFTSSYTSSWPIKRVMALFHTA